MNDLPKYIEALDAVVTCGSTELGSCVVMVDEQGQEICRLEKGTIREAKIALLWQAAPILLREVNELLEEAGDGGTVSWDRLCALTAASLYAINGDLKTYETYRNGH